MSPQCVKFLTFIEAAKLGHEEAVPFLREFSKGFSDACPVRDLITVCELWLEIGIEAGQNNRGEWDMKPPEEPNK